MTKMAISDILTQGNLIRFGENGKGDNSGVNACCGTQISPTFVSKYVHTPISFSPLLHFHTDKQASKAWTYIQTCSLFFNSNLCQYHMYVESNVGPLCPPPTSPQFQMTTTMLLQNLHDLKKKGEEMPIPKK